MSAETKETSADPQLECFKALMELNIKLAPLGRLPLTGPIADEINNMKNIFTLGATGLKPDEILELSASKMKMNFINRQLVMIKARIALSSSGEVLYPITWKNTTSTILIRSHLEKEGFNVAYVVTDRNLSVSDDGEDTYKKVESAEEANHLHVWL